MSDEFDSIFMIMEYIPDDLVDILDSVKIGTVISERNIIGITYNLLNSLNFLHRVGLMHRDLKPANILV